MVIEEYVVAVSAEAGVLLEERPHPIQRRPEFPADVVHRDAAANGRERAGDQRFDGYFVGHDSSRAGRTTFSTALTGEARSIQLPGRSRGAERSFSDVIASVSGGYLTGHSPCARGPEARGEQPSKAEKHVRLERRAPVSMTQFVSFF